MTEINDLLAPLNEKLDDLKKRQDDLSAEILELCEEITQLRNFQNGEDWVREDVQSEDHLETLTIGDVPNQTTNPPYRAFNPQIDNERPDIRSASSPGHHQNKSDLEKFIGENLINKIGIAITIIGVAIGAKYSIDHDLIVSIR